MDPKVWKALQYMLISISAFTIMNTLAKYLASVTAYQIVFFRSLSSLLLCLVLLKSQAIPLWGTHRRLLIARGLVGTISMLFFFLAVKAIPFGSAVSLRYLSPIFAAILAVLWLKEKISLLQWFCFLLAFAGVLLLKGFDARITIGGLALILTSAFFSGMAYVLIRRIGRREHPLVIVSYFMLTGTLLGGILSIFTWKAPIGSDWLALASLGVFGLFGQLYMTKAYQEASVGTVAPMKYLESVFAIMIGWIWFGEGYQLLGLVGITLVISGMLLNLFVKKKRR